MKNSNAIRFDQRSFNRGVDDVLTLRPLRKGISDIVAGTAKAAKSVSEAKPSAKAPAKNLKK